MEQYEGIGRKEEEEHLKDCVEIIQKNVDYYQEKERVMAAEIKEMYDIYRSSNPELHNELVIEIGMREQVVTVLSKQFRRFANRLGFSVIYNRCKGLNEKTAQ